MHWGVYIRGMDNRKSEHILFSPDQEQNTTSTHVSVKLKHC